MLTIYQQIFCQNLSLFAKFLDKLKATPDGDGNLLDHTTLLYGSCLSNSNIHSHNPLPTLLAGGGAGTLKGGRHLKYPEYTPMANLLLSVLNKVGVPADKLGDSTGAAAYAQQLETQFPDSEQAQMLRSGLVR